MLDYHNDSQIKIGYNPVSVKRAWELTPVGAHSFVTIDEVDYTDTDDNTVYVSDTSGDDADTGTKLNPKKTLVASINATTYARPNIVILDSEKYAEDISVCTTTYFKNIYKDTGETPIVSLRTLPYADTDSNTIYTSKLSGNDSTGTGTRANPYATICYAADQCDATHKYLMILDSEVYEEEGINVNADFKEMYADTGCAPTYKPHMAGDGGASNYNNKTELVDSIDLDIDSDTAIWNYGNCVSLLEGKILYNYLDTDDKGVFSIQARESEVDEAGIIEKTVEYESTTTTGTCAIVMSNTNIMILYTATGGVCFVIYDNVGNLVKAKTAIHTGSMNSDGVFGCSLRNGDVALCYCESSTIYTAVYSNLGILLHGPTSVGTYQFTDVMIAPIETGGYMITYIYSYVTYARYYNDSAVYQNSITVDGAADNTYSARSATAGGEYFVIAYWKYISFETYSLFMKKYHNDGTQSGSTATIATESNNSLTLDGKLHIERLQNTDIVLIYGFGIAPNCEVDFKIWKDDGTTQRASDHVDAGTTPFPIMGGCITTLGEFVSFFFDGGTGDPFYNKWQPYTWKCMDASLDTIDGIIFDMEWRGGIEFVLKDIPTLVEYCTFKNIISNIPDPKSCISESGLGEHAFLNNLVIDVDYGFHVTSISAAGKNIDIKNNVFCRLLEGAAIEITQTAYDLATNEIKHNDFYNCKYGIVLNANGSAIDDIKNNNFHDNITYAIDSETTITITNCVLTDSVDGVTLGASIVNSDPLYVNEGSEDADDTNMKLQTREEGYYVDSPAVGLADDDKNSGAYDVIFIGEDLTYTDITINKPITGIRVWHEPVGAVKLVNVDGEVTTSRTGMTEYLELSYSAIEKSEYDYMLAIWECGNPKVKIYPDPTTNPNDYNVYNLIYSKIIGSPKHYKLSDSGANGVKMIFARKYEAA